MYDFLTVTRGFTLLIAQFSAPENAFGGNAAKEKSRRYSGSKIWGKRSNDEPGRKGIRALCQGKTKRE